MRKKNLPAFDAWRAGADACYAGRGIAECPYSGEGFADLAEAWRAGWIAVVKARCGWSFESPAQDPPLEPLPDMPDDWR